VSDNATWIRSGLRAPALRQPAQVQAAFAVIVTGQVRLITTVNSEIAQLGEVVSHHFGRHRDAETYTSQPGLGVILGARVLAEFGDIPSDKTGSVEQTSRVLWASAHQQQPRDTTSQQRSHLLTTSRRTVCCKTSPKIRANSADRQPPPEQSLPNNPGTSH
jgi:hypothetical protein